MYRSAFPDLTYRIEDLFGAGDKVVLRWTATATGTIGFMGRPPTGRRASATGINIYRLAGGMLAQAADADGLAGIELLACNRAWLAALRGEAPAAQAALAGLGDLRASEDPQSQAAIAVAEAFTAAAPGQPAAALRHARTALDQTAAIGISHEYLRWAWPLAARAAYDLAGTATTGGLLALLEGYQPGQLAPMQRAERDLARARLAAADAGPAFAAAIIGLRQYSTPYHLAHGLLDHAAHLAARGDDQAAAAAIGEAAGIARRLRCQPLLDRAETIQPARPRTAASG